MWRLTTILDLAKIILNMTSDFGCRLSLFRIIGAILKSEYGVRYWLV